jgi:hypothetical protein
MKTATLRPTLLVIRSDDVERAVNFYAQLGLQFTREKHGAGAEHYAAVIDGWVFEIYPVREGAARTSGVRLGFAVDDVDEVVARLRAVGAEIVTGPSEGRAVVKDGDGNVVVLT